MKNNVVASLMQGTRDLGACGFCCTDFALFLNGIGYLIVSDKQSVAPMFQMALAISLFSLCKSAHVPNGQWVELNTLYNYKFFGCWSEAGACPNDF